MLKKSNYIRYIILIYLIYTLIFIFLYTDFNLYKINIRIFVTAMISAFGPAMVIPVYFYFKSKI